MDEGAGASHTNTVTHISMPDDVELTELIVSKMPTIIKDAITSKFVYGMSDRAGGSRYKCGRYAFTQRVKTGIGFVTGYLASH